MEKVITPRELNVYEKLAIIQKGISVPKNNVNEYGKYNYRSCEDILAAVKPLLEKTGTVLTLDDEVVLINERYYVKATATLVSTTEEDGKLDVVSNCGYAREEEVKKGMDASQITGSCSSYARKYALAGLFLLDSEKDADTRDNREPEERPTENKMTKKITDTQLKTLRAKCEADKVDEAYICKSFHIKDLKELTGAQYKVTLDNWEKVKTKGAK
jgi:hypothetical protein